GTCGYRFFAEGKGGLRHGSRTLFTLLVLSEVVAHGDGDLLDRLVPDARHLAELFGGHVGELLDGGDAGGDELLHDAFADLGDLLDGRVGSAGHGLHLLLDLLTLLLLGLDVNLPAEELGGEADVLSLLAEVGDGDARDLGGLEGLLGEGGDLFGELDDVDLFPAELADDGLHTHAL